MPPEPPSFWEWATRREEDPFRQKLDRALSIVEIVGAVMALACLEGVVEPTWWPAMFAAAFYPKWVLIADMWGSMGLLTCALLIHYIMFGYRGLWGVHRLLPPIRDQTTAQGPGANDE